MQFGRNQDPADHFNAPLIERLRGLSWPAPPPDLRARCLERIRADIESADLERGRGRGGSLPGGMVHDFTALRRNRRSAA